MRILIILIAITSYSFAYSQKVFSDFPLEGDSIKSGDIIIAGYIDWRYSGFTPSIDTLVLKLKTFMLRNSKYSFTIKVHRNPGGDEQWLLKVSEQIAQRLDREYLRNDKEFAKKVKFNIIGVGVSKVLFPKDLVDKELDPMYKIFMDRLNRRVEVVID